MMSNSSSGDRKAVQQDASGEMEKYSITRAPIDFFYYKEYRYTNVKDAIAQAKRQHPEYRGYARRHLRP